jgi:hypothetical protein
LALFIGIVFLMLRPTMRRPARRGFDVIVPREESCPSTP